MVGNETVPESAEVVATDDHLATTIDGEAVILALDSGTYYGFNEVASHLWELIQEPRTVAAVCDEIHATYDDVSAEQCRRDVQSVLQEMAATGLVEIDPEPTAAD